MDAEPRPVTSLSPTQIKLPLSRVLQSSQHAILQHRSKIIQWSNERKFPTPKKIIKGIDLTNAVFAPFATHDCEKNSI